MNKKYNWPTDITLLLKTDDFFSDLHKKNASLLLKIVDHHVWFYVL